MDVIFVSDILSNTWMLLPNMASRGTFYDVYEMLHWNGNIDWSDLSNISYLSISRFEDTCVSVDLGTILGTQFRVTSSTVEVRLVHQDWGRIQLLGASGALETSFVESFPSSWESLGIIDVFVTLGTFLPLQILYISWHPAPAPDSWLVQVPLTPCIPTPGLLSSWIPAKINNSQIHWNVLSIPTSQYLGLCWLKEH